MGTLGRHRLFYLSSYLTLLLLLYRTIRLCTQKKSIERGDESMIANELCLTEIQSSCVLPSFNCVPQAQDEASVSSQDSGIGSATSLIEEDPSSILDETLNRCADLSN